MSPNASQLGEEGIRKLDEQWTAYPRTRAGAQVRIRPLRPDDREREIAFLNGLSQQSRYFRLMTPFKFLPPHLVDQLMDIDYAQRMAFVATIPSGGGEEFVGIARYGETDEAEVAELGITVADAWHRTGIARLLVAHLLRFAQWRGIRTMTGIVLPENAPMIALARSLGFSTAFDPDQHLVKIRLDLADAARGETRVACGEALVRQRHLPH
jgi:RimJ/RimL family protein N-acetyltransferase